LPKVPIHHDVKFTVYLRISKIGPATNDNGKEKEIICAKRKIRIF